MIIPHFEFKYTWHGIINTKSGYTGVIFTSNASIIDPNKEYECKVLAGEEIYHVLGINILDPCIRYSELLSQYDQTIPLECSAEEVLALLGAYNQIT
ncbi:MAG: hypothetical protein ACO3TG_02620 [Minisyncoccia bacterium]